MKSLGVLILLIGIVGLVAAFGMDTSVDTGFGRVNNLGLMKDQQNYITVAALLVLIGIVLMVASSRSEQTSATDSTKICPQCAEIIKRDAKICRFCGNRDFAEGVPVGGSTGASAMGSPQSPARRTWWHTTPAVLGAVLVLSAAAIGAIWLWGDGIDASGNGTYTAKDVLVGAWMDLSAQTVSDAGRTESENEVTVDAQPTGTDAADFRKWPSAAHRRLSPPDAKGCIKELAEEAGLHC